ncbi:phosphotransferase [Fodinicola feengrottensis]|uniref:Phosphotransferase n=1 Tax=Fodinicola feengrottensis TaxID=435914 RepID=A0ABN2IHM2_9ACTN
MNPAGRTDEAVRAQAIETAIASPHPARITALGHRSDSVTYLVNERFVFRFPKVAGQAVALQVQTRLLPELAPRLPAPVPELRFVGQTVTGLPYVGYPQLTGQFLTADRFLTLDSDARSRVLDELAAFIAALRATTLELARGCGVPDLDFLGTYTADRDRFRDEFAARMSAAEAARIELRFADYLGDPANFDYEPVLLHNALSVDHILCDPTTGAIRGVLDFAAAAIGDPDYELRHLAQAFGLSVALEVAIRLGHHDRTRLVDKLDFFVAVDALRLAMRGPRRGDRALVRAGLGSLR